MIESWEIKKFTNCLQKVRNTTKITKKQFLNTGLYPVISQEASFINGYWDNKEDLLQIEKPVVIFGDHTKVIKYVDFSFVRGADGVKVLLPIEEINSKFFSYQIQSIKLRDLGYARHYRLLKEEMISIPPLNEQKEIVSILDDAFASIDKAKANIERNIENAKELFQSKLNEIFSQTGEGWEKKILKSVARYDKSKYIGFDRPFVGLEHIESNTGSHIGSLDPVSVKSSTFQFDQRHVLYGRLRPYLNKVYVPLFEGHCSTEIFPILPNEELNREFLFYWLITPDTVSKIDSTWTGARMPRANMNEVINFTLPVPDIDTQAKTVKALNRFKIQYQKIINSYESQLKNIDELRKSILQKAFSGELTNKSVAA
ncbi:MAG: hypothetical protein CMP71_06550 [Flavobacteriales bacterium]|nr:hypothetical protein [Flavobacteriales bacterium]|tara:strand:+ start:510 stop:1622 length:1113 start_codon:yes stop_codon:yes gene_type:complete